MRVGRYSRQLSPSFRSLWSVFFTLGFVACQGPPTFVGIPESPGPIDLNLGLIEKGGAVEVSAPTPLEGARIHERIDVRLQALGIAPLRAEFQGSGSWASGADGSLQWVQERSRVTPEDGRLGDELGARLDALKSPENLPLEPLSFLNDAAGTKTSKLPESGGVRAGSYQISGHWRCERIDGSTDKGAKARELSCVLMDGHLIQVGTGPHKGVTIKARLIGALRAMRVASDDTTPSVEEVRLELGAEASEPRPLMFETSYHRIWCARGAPCPAAGF